MSNIDKNREFFRSFKPVKVADAPAASGYSSEIIFISINPTGNRLVNSRTDKTLRVWKCFPDGLSDPVVIEAPHSRAVECVAWNPKTEFTFASVGRDEWVKIWRCTGRLENDFKVASAADEPVSLHLVSYSADGEVLAVVDRSSCVRFYGVNHNYAPVGVVQLDEHVYDLRWFHHQHEFFAAALHDGAVAICAVAGTAESLDVAVRAKLAGHRSSVTALALDPRGQHMVAGSNEGVVSVWETQTMSNSKVITDVDEAIAGVDISRDGAYVAVAYHGGANARVYELTSRQLVLEVPDSTSGKTVSSCVRWFPNKTSFVYVEAGKTMVYMRKA